jgi:16S rRNA (uracil1498-N3)-methyltransferase
MSFIARGASAPLIGRLRHQFNFKIPESQRNLLPDAAMLIIPSVARRIHVKTALRSGLLTLDATQAHHLRDVLRLDTGATVEVFDDTGNTAAATVETCDPHHVVLRVGDIIAAAIGHEIVVAAAVPKGDRADWMIEKLSELGVSRFIPLITQRSVVQPKGQNKLDRWQRIATESAKQSRRAGVMEIGEIMTLERVVEVKDEGRKAAMIYLSPSGIPISSSSSFLLHRSSFLLVGPEGGFTEDELALMDRRGLTGVKLTGTILRVETAAFAAAAVVACMQQQAAGPS